MNNLDRHPYASFIKRAEEVRRENEEAKLTKNRIEYAQYLEAVLQNERNRRNRIEEGRKREDEAIQTRKAQQDALKEDEKFELPTIELPEIEHPDSIDGWSDNKKQKNKTKADDKFITSLGVSRPVINNTLDSLMASNNGFKKRPRISVPKSELDAYFDERAKKEADAEYDGRLQQLYAQKDALTKQLLKEQQMFINNQISARNTGAALPIFGNGLPSESRLDQVNTQIKQLEKERDRYIASINSLTSSKSLFSDQLASVISQSDAYLDQMIKTKNAKDQAALQRENIGFFGLFSSKAQKPFIDAANKFLIELQNEYALGDEMQKLSNYIESLGYLPKSLEEIPKQYRNAARKAFTKNGKLLLEDQSFRDDFNAKNVVEKDDFEALSNVAKKQAKRPILLDEDLINNKKEEFEILKDAERFLKHTDMAKHSLSSAYLGSKGVFGNTQRDEAYAQYSAAERILDKALNYQRLHKELIPVYEESPVLAQGKASVTAFKEFFSNPNTYLFDMPDIADAISLKTASDKLYNGLNLSIADKELLGAKMIEDIFHGEYGDYEDKNAYKWSEIAAESLKFMAEFIATQGVSAELQTIGKGGAKAASKALAVGTRKAAAKAASKKLLEDIALNQVIRRGYGAEKLLVNAATRLGADATYAAFLTNTLGLPRTILDAETAQAGKISGDFDIFGNPIATEVENKVDAFDAFRQSEVRNWIENFSEMMGEWGIGRGLKAVGKKLPGLSKMLTNIERGADLLILRDVRAAAQQYLRTGVVELNALLSKAGLKNLIPALKNVFNRQTLKAGQFHGFTGEVSEEYYGLILQHLLGVQDDPDKSLVLDIKDQSLDIIGGIAVSTGLLGAMGMAGSIRSLVKHSNALNNLISAFGNETATEIQKALAFAHPIDIMQKFAHLANVYGNAEPRSFTKKLSDLYNGNNIDKKTALAEYVQALLEYRGAVYGEDVIDRLMGHENKKLLYQARNLGYTTGSYRSMKMMDDVKEILKNDYLSLLDPESVGGNLLKQYLDLYETDNNIIAALQNIDDDKVLSPSNKETAKNALLAYHNAVQYRNGVDLRVTDLLEGQIRRSNGLISRLVNRNTGKLVRLYRTTEDGRKENAYLIDGELRTDPNDRTIISAKSEYGANDNGKVLVSTSGGTLSYKDRSELESQGWEIDATLYYPEVMKRVRENQLRDQLQQQIDAITREIGLNPITGESMMVGDKVFTILDNKGGITYSISDEDGENAEIHHVDSVKDLKELIKNELLKNAWDITKFFKDDAAKLISSMRNARSKHATDLAREEYKNKEWDEVEEPDDEEPVYTPDSYRGRLAAQKKSDELQALWESRDFDDVIDTTPEDDAEEPETREPVVDNSDQLHSIWESRDFDDTIDTTPEPGETLPPPPPELIPSPENVSAGKSVISTDPNSQDEAYNKLLEDIDRASAQKEADATGYHYFINTGRRTQLHRRVHTVIPDQYGTKSSVKKLKETAARYLTELKSSWQSVKGVDEKIDAVLKTVENIISQRREEWLSVNTIKPEHYAELAERDLRFSLNIEKYKQYLKDQPREVNEVLNAISEILTRNIPNPSVVTGNVYDTIARVYLDSRHRGTLDYNNPELTLYYYGKKVHISDLITYYEKERGTGGKVVEKSDPLVSKEAFDAICKELQEIKSYYENVLGWKLCTTPYTLHANLMYNGKTIKVAGETDCIGIDGNGKRHIIDFKTHNNTKLYHDKKVGGIIKPSELYSPVNLGEHDSEGKSLITYSTAVQYAMLMHMYKMLANVMGNPMASSEALFFAIQKELHGSLFATITEKNVKNSRLRINVDGKLVPNRQNLDEYDKLMRGDVGEVLKKLREQFEAASTDEFDRAKNELKAAKVDIDVNYDIVGKDLVQEADQLNKDIDDILNEPSSKDQNIIRNSTERMKALLEKSKALKQRIELTVNDYNYKEQAKKIALTSLERIYGYQSDDDINTIVEEEFNNSYIIEYIKIEDQDLDELDNDQILSYFNALLRLQLCVNYATALGVTSDNIRKYQLHIQWAKDAILRPKGIVYQFETAVVYNAFPIDEEVENKPIKRDSLEITGLNDHSKKPDVKTVDKSVGNKGTKLEDIMTLPDFVNSAEFRVQRDLDYKGKDPRFEIIIIYNGETFSPVTLNIGHTVENDKNVLTENARDFYKQLVSLTDEKNGGVRQVVINNSCIHRTFGLIRNTELTHKIDTNALLGKELSDVTFDNDQNEIGLTRTQRAGGKVQVIVTKPGKRVGDKNSIMYVYNGTNTQTNPSAGVYVILYSPGYEETADRNMKAQQKVVPINAETVNFREGDAQLIADILSGIYLDSDSRKQFEDGEMTLIDVLQSPYVQDGKRLPFNNIDVLQMFISWGRHNQKGEKQHIHLYPGKNGNVHITGIINGVSLIDESTGEIGAVDIEFDLKTTEGRQNFILFLTDNIRMQVFEENMRSRLNKTTIGKGIAEYFDKNESEDSFKFGTSSVLIDIEDVSGKGISGAAFYIKSGMLQTRFDSLSRPLISIHEEGAINESATSGGVSVPVLPVETPGVSITQSDDDAIAVMREADEEYIYEDDYDPYLLPSVQDEANGETINEEEARERIKQIVGDIFVPEFADDVLATVQNGRVVGACYANMIRLSKKAARGTEYHEAFHRVLELLVPTKVRERAYAKYRKKWGKNLSDLEIAERAADEFWWYKDNIPQKKWSWNFKELLNILKQWYKFFTKIGSYDLYRLYKSASNGKYKSCTPTKEALERWKNLTTENGGFLASTFSINGVDYNHIVNSREYYATIDTVKSILLNPETYSRNGKKSITTKTIQDLKINIDTLANAKPLRNIIFSPKYSYEARLKLLEILGCTTKKDKAGNRIIVKINDNGDKILNTALSDIRSYESKGFTEEAELKKQQKRGITKKLQEEIELTSDQDGYVSELELTEQREMGEYSKISAEFDPITQASARVKFFFSILPDTELVNILKDGKPYLIRQKKLNSAGLPQMADFKKAWGIVVNQVYFCRSQKLLYERLQQLAQQDSLFEALLLKYEDLLRRAYGDEHGNFMNSRGEFNPIRDNDAAGEVIEITSTMCHAKLIPQVIESIQNSNDLEVGQTIRVMDNSLEYTCRNTKRQWSAAISSGEGPIIGKDSKGRYYIKDGYSAQTFSDISLWFHEFFNLLSDNTYDTGRQKYSNKKNRLSVTPEYTVVNNGKLQKDKYVGNTLYGEDCINGAIAQNALCEEFVKKLNQIGIGFTIEDFRYILSSYNGATLLDRMKAFANDVSQNVHGSFCSTIETLANVDSPTYSKFITQVWSNYGHGRGTWLPFIEILSKSRYYRICNEMMLSFLTIGGKKHYALSEHNAITDIVDEMGNPDSEKIAQLSNDPYYLIEGRTGKHGSIVFEYLNDEVNAFELSEIHFQPSPGLKTDSAGSSGIEYLDFSEQEDVVAKYGMLAANGLIMPTLADKTTYGCIYFGKNFKAFGIDWTTEFGPNGEALQNVRNFLGNNYKPEIRNGEVYLRFNDDILRQFIKYAKLEYESAKFELERYNKLEDHEKVANFHKNKVTLTVNGKEENYNVIQGARLSTFTGILQDDGNGKYKFVSFNSIRKLNGEFRTEAECLADADKMFFSRSEEEQMEMMRILLSHQVQKELNYLQSLGMINVKDGMYQNSVASDGRSKGLDKFKLNQMQWFMSEDETRKNYVSEGVIHHDALVAYVADMVCKAQMSHQESFRMFTGNLACYKWKYDSNSGDLIDTTTDYFKRTGGLVSTGTHNVEDVPGIPDKVRCAEIINEEFNSPFSETFKEQALIQELKRELRRILYSINTEKNEKGETVNVPITIDNSTNNTSKILEIRKHVDSLNLDQLKSELRAMMIEQRLKDLRKDNIDTEENLTSVAEKEVDTIINSIISVTNNKYKKLTEVDVNDGATYITDDFCEILLKAIGKWDQDIADAFLILRGESIDKKDKDGKEVLVKFSQLETLTIAEAYRRVYTTVIGTQKYTAFGQRVEDSKDRDDLRTRALTYFDKTAFFPIFECMASGNMKAVLRKMKDLNVLVLKTTSAIKEGSRGAVKLDLNTFDEWNSDETNAKFESFSFNPYEQEFKELRKQFNTDPKGKEYMPLGSQYQKVVLSLIEADTVVDVNGQTMDAYAIREQVMEAYLKIMEAGLDNHAKKFYDKDGKLDIDSFLSILKKQLSDKDAGDPLLEALSIETYTEIDQKTKKPVKKKRFKIPVAAMSSGTWIESIVTSIINKDIIDVTSPGSAFYQRSAWASEGKMSDNLRRIVSEEDWLLEINHGAPLQEKNELGSMDIVLSIDFFDYLFEGRPRLKGQSFEVKKAWLIKNGIISGFVNNPEDFPEDELVDIDGRKWHNAKTNIVGYRIPTQAVSSIHAMRCVDVIPVVRDTVILPKEVTAVTGSDFDIDKFFLSTKYYDDFTTEEALNQIEQVVQNFGFESRQSMINLYESLSKKKDKTLEDLDTIEKINLVRTRYEEIERKGTKLSDQYDSEKDKKKHYLNNLIDIQIALLQTNDNNISKLHGSIDADTQPLQQIAKELNKSKLNQAIESFDASSLRVNVTAKMSFAIGKKGIGPFALNNNNHVFTMLYGVKFVHNANGILGILDLEDLSKSNDRHGRSILSWISGLINAHVDVAKDPYIRSLGVNQYTYNLVNLLIRTGYGAETFWFTTQPIMKQIYRVYDSAAGVYSQDETVSQHSRTATAVTNFFLLYVLNVVGTYVPNNNAAFKEADIYLKNKYGDRLGLNSFIKALMKYDTGVGVLKTISCMREDLINDDLKFDIGISGGKKIDYKDIQLIVAIANFKLQEKAQELSQLVQYTKIDTKKLGTTIIEQNAYLSNFNKLLDLKNSPFEYNSIRNMIEKSFIGAKTREAIAATKKLMSSLIFEATEGFSALVDDLKEALHTTRTDERFMSIISKMVIAKIKSDYFFKGRDSYCIKRAIDPVKLISGPNNIYSLLVKIKAGLANLDNHAYDSIRGTDGQCNNYLINNLISHVLVTKDSVISNVESGSELDPDYSYSEDDWIGAGFIKSQNILEDSIKSSDMSNAWADLLNDSSNPDLQRFAELLVVYAFITSANNQGGYNLVKFVPPAWLSGECSLLKDVMNSEEESFASYINRQLEEMQQIKTTSRWSQQEIDELILNWSWNDDIIKTQSSAKINSLPQFSGTDGGVNTPIIIGAVYGLDVDAPVSAYSEKEWPGFIKVKTRSPYVLSGQRKYDIYKWVANGRAMSQDGKTVVTYPIYALVAPSGGIYSEGLKIFSMGIQDVANKNANFVNYWSRFIDWFMNTVPNKDKFVSPADLFMELIYMKSSQPQMLEELFESLPESGREIANSLLLMIDHVENNRISLHDPAFLGYEERIKEIMGDDVVDFNKEATELHLELIPDSDGQFRYKPMNEADETHRTIIQNSFGKDIFNKIATLRNSVFNVEFYKKSAKDGKSYNVTAAVSYKNAKRKGWFEINANVDLESGKYDLNGSFSVHFKTYVPQMGKDVRNASVQMNSNNKTALIKRLLYLAPDGSRISTFGTLSKGGVKMLQNLNNYHDDKLGVYLMQEGTRTVEIKSGEKVEIPVWVKSLAFKGHYLANSTSFNLDDFDADAVPTFTISPEKTNVSKEELYKVVESEYAEAVRAGIVNFKEDLAIFSDIFNSNENLKIALIKTGIEPINIFNDSYLDSLVYSCRQTFQLEISAKETELSCKI